MGSAATVESFDPVRTGNEGLSGNEFTTESEARFRPFPVQRVGISTTPDIWEPELARSRARSIVATEIDEKTVAQLAETHQQLAIKKVEEGLSHDEELTLAMTRWKLDAIEDAMTGPALDMLESLVQTQEQFGRDLRATVAEMRAIAQREGER